MKLRIVFHEQPCGWLQIDNERMQFQYDEAYLATRQAPLSVAMPLREEAWPDAVSFPFFENLLPEGNIRHLLAETLRTADNNFERLLLETGGDVAGAISIQPAEGSTPPESTSAPLPPALSDRELGQCLKQIETRPFLPQQTQGMRLSLAGAQNKLPVVLDAQGNIHLPGQHASTHIIKPPSARFPGLVENEYLCMRAAVRAGLRVPAVQLRNFVSANGEQHDCYVIERYDREEQNGYNRRLHQEDMCQILGLPSAHKYVQDGGPGFRELFQVLRQHTRPAAVQQQELIRRMLFNLLIGNQDAHGKNFALLHLPTGIVLAPVYDLVSTLVYPELSPEFAMPIGQARTVEELNAEALDAFQGTAGVNLKRQAGRLKQFVRRALQALEDEAVKVQEEVWPGSEEMLREIVQRAERHANVLGRWLG